MKTEYKHTLGPWRSPKNTMDDKGLYISTPDGNFDVCEIKLAYAPNAAEAHANAKLIAAAPDMLEALQNVINAEAVGDKIDFKEILAAIHKATGGNTP